MKINIYLLTLFATIFISMQILADDRNKDSDDPRGKMKPWEKGAWETGKYRNIFSEAGYKQEDIDAKLAKAYHDVFEGSNRVYFEVGDSMAYVSDLKNHDARTEGLSYGMMVAVQLNKKEVFDRLWRWTKKICSTRADPEMRILPGVSNRKPGNIIRKVQLPTENYIL